MSWTLLKAPGEGLVEHALILVLAAVVTIAAVTGTAS